MTERKNTVTFIGHRTCPDLDHRLLAQTIENLVKAGKHKFLCGGLGEFDNLCAELVHQLRGDFPKIRSHLIACSRTQSVPNPALYDTITFPTFLTAFPKKTVIIYRNRFMVEHIGLAVCYVKRESGGAARTFRYAKEKNIPLINLAGQ